METEQHKNLKQKPRASESRRLGSYVEVVVDVKKDGWDEA